MMIRLPHSCLALPLALALSSCGPAEKPTAASPASTQTPEAAQPVATAKPEVKEEAKPAAPDPAPAAPAQSTEKKADMATAEEAFKSDHSFPAAVDIGGFGSDEPAEREDMPTRGIIAVTGVELERSNGAHWETYTCTSLKTKRWGRYQVRMTYVLNRASLGMQFRMGDLVVKKSLASAQVPKSTFLGEVYIAQPGDVPFAMLTPPTDGQGFDVEEIALIPTCEGEMPKQSDDGSIVLNAKDAITWSENMRYEPKAEKNCLGFWTSEEDMAEWEFEVTKPGRYKVTLSHGCGGGNHGSEVELKHGEQSLKFVTEDTGGFQNWKELPLGEIEIKGTGRQRLMIAPRNKVKSAVLDVQKVVLTPVG